VNGLLLVDKAVLPFSTFEPTNLTVTELCEPLNLPDRDQTVAPSDLTRSGINSAAESVLEKPVTVAAQAEKAPTTAISPTVTESVSHSVTVLAAPSTDITKDGDLEVNETAEEATRESLLTPVEVERLAEFSRALFQTWESLALQEPRADQSHCWGVNISIDAVYREGFQSVSMHRFLNLLGQLAKVNHTTGQMQMRLSQKGSQEPVILNDVPANKITYYDPQKGLDLKVSSKVDHTTHVTTNAVPSKFDNAREAIAVRVDRAEQGRVKQDRKTRRQQGSEHSNVGFNLFQNLKRFLTT